MSDDETPDLFGYSNGKDDPEDTDAYARRDDPDTSHEAAESVRPTELEAIVLQALREWGESGATSWDLCDATGLTWQTLSPRLRPLIRKGFAVDTGLRRLGPSGRNCIVFRAA